MIDFATARGIADAVLYEGYLLFPYTASSPKNSRVRWQFGVVVPRAYESAETGEHGHQQTEVAFAAQAGARIDVRVRFLQVQVRTIEARDGAGFRPVATLRVDGTDYVTFEETVEREVVVTFDPSLPDVVCRCFMFDAATETEDVRDAGGAVAGRVVRSRWPLSGRLTIVAEALTGGTPIAGVDRVQRLQVRIENDSEIVAGNERGAVLRTAFVSAHTLLGISAGAFYSPIDPPQEAGLAFPGLVNEHTWPVLIGGDGSVDAHRSPLVLSSPIILCDFPQIGTKTESDAFDATEIDELLTLSVLSLSDAERAEARATDPRARAIVERAEAFGVAEIARLHDGESAFAQVVPTLTDDALSAPIFRTPVENFEDVDPRRAPPPQRIVVAGVSIEKGSSVRLMPKRRADSSDMFIMGKIATVQAIHQDFEAKIYVAVTVDDDPASEFHQWYGRSLFFDSDEVEPLGAGR